MGTFDSIYNQKIRSLEEENNQLRKLIREWFWPFGKRRDSKPERPDRFTPVDNDVAHERHSEDLQAHLDIADQHYGSTGLNDTAIPHLERANRLIDAGHGSFNQHDHLSHMVAQLDPNALPTESPLRALRRRG